MVKEKQLTYLTSDDLEFFNKLKEQDRKRKESVKKHIQKYQEENPVKRLYHTAKGNAQRRGIEFTIQESDITVPTHCPYLGCELTSVLGNGRVWSNMSLDRIDSTKGYIPGNVQIISDLANRMKQNATTEQLVVFAENVLRLHKTQ